MCGNYAVIMSRKFGIFINVEKERGFDLVLELLVKKTTIKPH